MGRRGPQPSATPTARQREVLAFISGYIDRAGYPPTLREIDQLRRRLGEAP